MAVVNTNANIRGLDQGGENQPPITPPKNQVPTPSQFLEQMGVLSSDDRKALVSKVLHHYGQWNNFNPILNNKQALEVVVDVLREMSADEAHSAAQFLVKALFQHNDGRRNYQFTEKAAADLIDFALTAKVDPQCCWRTPGDILSGFSNRDPKQLEALANRVLNDGAGYYSAQGTAAAILISLDPRNGELRDLVASRLETPYVGLTDSGGGQALKIGEFARAMLGYGNVSAARIVMDKVVAEVGGASFISPLANLPAWIKLRAIPMVEAAFTKKPEDLIVQDGRVLMAYLSGPVESSLVEGAAGALAKSTVPAERQFGMERLAKYWRRYDVSEAEITSRLAPYKENQMAA